MNIFFKHNDVEKKDLIVLLIDEEPSIVPQDQTILPSHPFHKLK